MFVLDSPKPSIPWPRRDLYGHSLTKPALKILQKQHCVSGKSRQGGPMLQHSNFLHAVSAGTEQNGAKL